MACLVVSTAVAELIQNRAFTCLCGWVAAVCSPCRMNSPNDSTSGGAAGMTGSASTGGASPTQDARPQLHGWKDIAAHFGRSVRTVQRWERDFGLPIRRYGLGRAELVHAYLEDLERWKATTEAQAARRTLEAGEEEAPPPPQAARPRRRIALLATASLLTILAIVIWSANERGLLGGLPRLSGGNGSAPATTAQAGALAMEPGGWDFVGNSLVVNNASGQLLWKHDFPFRLTDVAEPVPLSDPYLPVRLEDVNADGRAEVFAISHPADGRSEKYRFYMFSHDGRLLWDFARGGEVVFGETTYSAPFLARHIHFTPREAPDPRGSNIWLVSNHRPWFPSVLTKMDPDGKVLAEYWSAGYVTSIWEGVVAGRRVVLVGARNNESEGASLAMLDATHPSGSAPAAEARYQCRSCPPGSPIHFVQFPKPARLQPLRGTGPVIRINVDSASRITVWVAPAHDTEGQPRPDVIYTLDADLRPLSVGVNDAFDAGVRALAGRKLIPEPPSTPAIDEVQTIRWWDGSRFIDLTAPQATMRTMRQLILQ